MTMSTANTASINSVLNKKKSIRSHLDEQLSSLRLGSMKQALSQQQAQSVLNQDMGGEERPQLRLSHEREQRKINRLEKQARFQLSGQIERLDYRAN